MSSSIVEASIADLQHALTTGDITSVELVAKYLLRIFTYDCRGPFLNSIPILNPDVFDEAAASDARRRAGKALGPLEGIPYTLKDSMKYKGMTCATGSPAVKDLVANEDSFVAEKLRNTGAVCIGRTNTPPFMASGCHRGVHGLAGSPYNLNYLTAAFSSGSSNGAGTSTAASFAAFGLGSETVSSGRSPASNNALVAYTPSRCMISPRGIWPLYPTCDVVVPMTRTVEDMMTILDVLTVRDSQKDEDFWRQQTFVQVAPVPRPGSFLDLISGSEGCISGKRIAVPKAFIGDPERKSKAVAIAKDVIELYRQARMDLEAMGATVVETNFPLVTNYEDDSVSGEANNVVGFKSGWNGKERGELVAYLWDDFLKSNGDRKYPELSSLDGSQMFPRPTDLVPDKFMEHKNFMNYPGLVELARNRNGKSIWDIDGIAEALPSLEAQRKRDLEDWMDRNAFDFVVFPANGDVGKADLETNEESAKHALQNGVKYSIGNRALRHMGVPTASVSMGILAKSKMPMNLTFAGKHGQDSELLKYAYAFEQYTKHRIRPQETPALESDRLQIGNSENANISPATLPKLVNVLGKKLDSSTVQVTGSLEGTSQEAVELEAFVDGLRVPKASITVSDKEWVIEAEFASFKPPKPLYGGVGQVVGNVNVVILARSGSCVAGKLVTIPQNS